MEQAIGGHGTGASYPNEHTPEERRKLSNLGHWLEGGVLAAAAGLALLDAVEPELGWPRRWAPRIASGAGVALGGFILVGSLHHGGPRIYLRHEHQDRQHLEMAALIAVGGGVEAAGDKWRSRLGLAGALAGTGALFLAHEQHGTGDARAQAERTHRRLGYSLIAAGAAKTADSFGARGPWHLVWPVLGLAVAGQLLAYREPVGAYE